MKLDRKLVRKMILKEMAKFRLPSNKNQYAKMDTSGIYGGTPYKNLTFEKIADIHRFLETAAFNGRHWMFPQGVDHDIYATLNALFVQRIGRADSNDPDALQRYAVMVTQVPGADISSIEEILDA